MAANRYAQIQLNCPCLYIDLLPIFAFKTLLMIHVLDNPVWSALISGNKNLAHGTEDVKYFQEDVSPFVGMRENSPENLETLYNLISFDRVIGFISTDEMTIPLVWKVVNHIKLLQMICDSPILPVVPGETIIALRQEHVPAMLELTKLTEPGPFEPKTIEFGNYNGIFSGNQLIAMAGQRFHPYQYTEISAVCTHPNFRGRGLAKQLIINQIHRIRASRGIPFLHVNSANAGAIRVYNDLGFVARKEFSRYRVTKNQAKAS
jgi:ribosomal protein S18 acetylase RimI-like enzyme